ncbi:hypothetical protein [Nitrosococcus watsonii]|uniref:Uncharacterized protein n=1 Tax=Nitrosococcus watsoni (strain C-113) TaxID=105559 RepID=D8KC49_NITWC|nr:hypothetical protein [Nitrosococcus watsonii]ADJ29720.1 conserved hypothetical protein [Nitrosococcus watsonii C-113]
MSKNIALTVFFMLAGIAPVFAMSNYDDPRILPSFKDKALPSELDILRVKTKISADNQLIFEVKTRGERTNGENGDYFLLQLKNGQSYTLLIPINQTKGNKILAYKETFQPQLNPASSPPVKLKKLSLTAGFKARYITNGIEYLMPMDLLHISHDFSYDAYTVHGNRQGDTLSIDNVYDQAGKGRKEKKRFSAITLLNKLCTTRKLILADKIIPSE